MIKVDKQKDSKNKQKIDITKSTQNLIYLVSPLNTDLQSDMLNVAKSNDIDRIQAIYETQMDLMVKKPFLKTSYNSFKDVKNGTFSYRSPYTNKYFPSLANNDGVLPSPLLRSIEEKGQLLFEEYAKMYYSEDCISNFFVQEAADELCFVFFAQNRYRDQNSQGIWSSTNIANISGDSTKSLSYKITTSVIYEVTNFIDSDQSKSFTLSGNLKRVKTESKKPSSDLELDQLHLTVVGRAIQDNQTYLRQQIQEVFSRKTKQIIFKTRVLETKLKVEQQRKMLKQLMSSNLVKKQNAIQF